MDEKQKQEYHGPTMTWKTNDQLAKITASRPGWRWTSEAIAAAKLELEEREAGLRAEPKFSETEAGYRIKIMIVFVIIFIILSIILVIILLWIRSSFEGVEHVI